MIRKADQEGGGGVGTDKAVTSFISSNLYRSVVVVDVVLSHGIRSRSSVSPVTFDVSSEELRFSEHRLPGRRHDARTAVQRPEQVSV